MNLKCRSYVLIPHIADPYAVSLVCDATLNNAPTTIRLRVFSMTNIEKFIEEKISEFSSLDDDYLEANDYCQILASLLYTLLINISP